MKSSRNPIIRKRTVIKFLKWSKRIVIPGFDKVPFYEVVRFFIHAMVTGFITTRGAAIAYSFFMAIFPSIIFLFTLIPYVPVENFQEILLSQLQSILPKEAYTLSKETIEDIINRPRGGLLSIGFISALFFSTSGISTLMDAFNQSSLVKSEMPWWKQRLIALFLLLIITFFTLVAVSLIIFNEMAMEYLLEYNIIDSGLDIFLIQIIRWFVIIALFYFTIDFIYYFTPMVKKRWKFFSAGASLATLLIIAASVGFSYYINNFGQYNKLYGSIGTLLVIMLWLYLISTFILIGFELNASIQSAKYQREK